MPPRASNPPMSRRASRDAFSAVLFVGMNLVIFLALAASVVGAAVLYSQGA